MLIAAKMMSFATQPLAWVLLLLAAGLWALQRGHPVGQRLCQAALLVLVLVGWQLPAETLLRHLENQSLAPPPQTTLQGFVGVVVLGGALERSALWQRPGQVALNSAAERMTMPVSLLQRHPQLRLLFTGGEGELQFQALTEADRAKIFFDSMGVPAQRVMYESASRTTYDNAVMSGQLPGVDKGQPWLLLTSAYHMPRSLAVFRKAGWNVTPYPVDFRTAEATDWDAFSFERGAEKWHLALHEIVGYWVYQLTGRI
jgi:uncharacterized SAM-binding protein YcdF (DUF218 family)